MESISTADLMQLLYSAREHYNNEFQYYIAVTFATIVASYAAGNRLTRSARAVVSILYILAAMIFLGSMLVYGDSGIVPVLIELRGRGIEHSYSIYVFWLRMALIAIATPSVLWFLWRNRENDVES